MTPERDTGAASPTASQRNRGVRTRPVQGGAAISALVAGMTILAGCQSPASPVQPTAMVVRIADYDGFVDEALSVLRERDFRPDRVDRERGVITAGPTTSAQWFELWRSDTPAGYERLESSLHTIRRKVRVDLEYVGAAPTAGTPGADAGGERYRLSVQVDKERYNTPSRQVTTASGALAIYSENLPTDEGVRRATAADARWTPLGRDGQLEGELLARLVDASSAAPVAD